MSERAMRLGLLAARARLLKEVRAFFDSRGFFEVHTPAIVPSPGLDVHLDAFEVRSANDHRVGWLATSPEYQMKRLLCDGASRIYQLGEAFRDDEHGALHERGFLMLEWYATEASEAEFDTELDGAEIPQTRKAVRGGADIVMRHTELLIEALSRSFFGKSELPTAWGAVDVAAPWPRLTVAEAFQRYANTVASDLEDDEDAFFLCLAEQVQPQLGHDRPVFLTEWPASTASLARLKPNGTADRFEAFVHGIELCNGFGELTDPTEQRRRFEVDQAQRRALGKPEYPIDERFLEDLSRGMPAAGGNALGVDRLLMLLLGAARIQDVMTFAAKQL